MRVQFSVVGRTERSPIDDIDMEAIPREGETVDLPGLEAEFSTVRTVVWFPLGPVEPDQHQDPFVYIVLGSPRP